MLLKIKQTLVTALLLTLAIVGKGAYQVAWGQAKQPHKTGVVKGVVMDFAKNTPVADAIISVINDTAVVLSNARGEYEIPQVKVGYASLYVVADGYQSVVTESFLVTAANLAVENIAMEQLLVEVGEVVVRASALLSTVESPVSMRRIGTEEIEMTPGANRDISKVAQSAPGVVVTPLQRNDILVRGGGANENKYYLDGIEIPVLNHFAVQGGSGGNASLVNTDLLQSVNFFTGAFPANFSNGLSSVMDMRMKEGNPDRFKAKLTLGASDVGASIDTPLSKAGKTTLLASYRRSYLQMLFSVLGLPFLPTYNDYQVKVSTKLNTNNELYFIALGSFDNNRLNQSIDNPDDDQKYILGYLPENKQSSYVVGAGYRHSFSGGQFRAIVSRNGFYNRLYKYKDNDESLPKTLNYDSRQFDNRLRAEVERWFDSGLRFSGGVGLSTGQYRNNTFRARYNQNNATTEHFESDINLLRYEFFATLSKGFFKERLSVLVGLRGDGMNYTSAMSNPLQQLSPRLGLSYRLTPQWEVNGSVARYHQEPAYTTLGYREKGVEVNKKNGLKYLAVNHYVGGVKFSPSQNSKFSLEGFYKAYSNYPVSLIDSLPLSTGDFESYSVGDVPVKSVGKGRAYGAEFSYRNLDFKHTVINLSYTLLYSQFQKMDENLRPTGVYMPSSWDVRHVLNLSAIHKFSRNWVLGAKWYLIGGFPYTPYNEELSSRIEAWDAQGRPYIDLALNNSERLKPYHQLDVRIDKMWYFNHWRLGFYVDIQNLYNFKSDGQAILMPQTDASGAYLPDPDRAGHYKMKHVKNDVGGTVLPTLGLVIEF